ncbi:hypothetical protein CCR75_009138 [Bremia lactucae]|uniref:Uncharacterized protein n=1 Tax=Bremia lactucae TaxID=4779 RepID=A0A976IH43_BRELC|nr:hypothetical protein CCR75_009365 [Bremia lactucae]TDH68595.1 hypothetical protein CCR75_003587 [Bremia lactucae]TDH71355.1 hypothetical protein CCR75_008358 [Bremia lactucae]TDH71881.1 hypothetical protein CCR75_004409 [Bremia lactucae]TDH73523.1 hypothetical protein CCR75_007030 [Bremia lactucae]
MDLIDDKMVERTEHPAQLPLLVQYWGMHYSAFIYTGRVDTLPVLEVADEDMPSNDTEGEFPVGTVTNATGAPATNPASPNFRDSQEDAKMDEQ